MPSSEQAWQQVTEQFRLFGDQVKKVYDERSGATDEAKHKFAEAMDTVTGALDTSVSAIGSTFADAEVKAHAQSATEALVGALSETFNEAASGLRRAWGAAHDAATGGSEEAPAPEIDADADSSATREEGEPEGESPHYQPAADTDAEADSSATREP